MDEEELQELYEEYMEHVFEIIANAQAVYEELLAEYVAQYMNDSLSVGGYLYNMLVESAVASAERWYSLYTPMHYKRRRSLSDPANISITRSISSQGASVTGSCSINNLSDQAEYAKSGFWIYTRNGKIWRPGGLEDDIPKQVPVDVDASVACLELTQQAFGAVL